MTSMIVRVLRAFVLTGDRLERVQAAPSGMFHVDLHEDCMHFSPNNTSITVGFKVELSPLVARIKSQNLARLREIAKINTRKIVEIPKSQNFVLANNGNNKVMIWKVSARSVDAQRCTSSFCTPGIDQTWRRPIDLACQLSRGRTSNRQGNSSI